MWDGHDKDLSNIPPRYVVTCAGQTQLNYFRRENNWQHNMIKGPSTSHDSTFANVELICHLNAHCARVSKSF